MHDVVGWKCRVCGATVALVEPAPWRCPNATESDRHHVLTHIRNDENRIDDKQIADRSATDEQIVDGAHRGRSRVGRSTTSHVSGVGAANPFIVHDRRFAWAAAAAAKGMTDAARHALVDDLDARVRAIDGVGFVTTPFGRSDALSDELGFTADGGVWVKDETGGVGGSQKARHLFSILLHLRASELLGNVRERSRLAIASCGNAALAAATLARAADWPIDVFVPTWMSDGFGKRLNELGAMTHRCERRGDDSPGDPALLRFREAVVAGAVPFTVQGPENALCLDGGRTIGWEITDQIRADQLLGTDGSGRLDRMFVQVGGGAMAACLGAGLLESGVSAPLIAVQTEGCAPFDRAVNRVDDDPTPGTEWATAMVPWDDPHSLADGILDDETYDWLGVLDAIRRSGGSSVVAAESNVVRAHELASAAGFDVSPTGAAGLAGVLQLLDEPGGDRVDVQGDPITPDDRIGIVLSGIAR